MRKRIHPSTGQQKRQGASKNALYEDAGLVDEEKSHLGVPSGWTSSAKLAMRSN